MRRADRLFEIIQILRRKKLVRARELADALEVSERTIYRDIRDMAASGVPIEGEVDREPGAHVYVDHAASWYRIRDELKQYGGTTGIEPKKD